MKHKNMSIHIHEDDIRNLCGSLIGTIMARHGHGYTNAQRLLTKAILQGDYAEALVANENLISVLKDTISELEANSKSLEDIEGAPISVVSQPGSATNT